MTYDDRRNRGINDEPKRFEPWHRSSTMGWIVGGGIAVALILVAAYGTSDNRQVSNNPPAITANAPTQNSSGATTGSGTTTIPKTPPPTNR